MMYDFLRSIAEALASAPDKVLRSYGSVIRGDTLYLAGEDADYELTLKRIDHLTDPVVVEALAQYFYYQDALEPMRWQSRPDFVDMAHRQFKAGYWLWEDSEPATKEQYRKKAEYALHDLSTKGETNAKRKP